MGPLDGIVDRLGGAVLAHPGLHPNPHIVPQAPTINGTNVEISFVVQPGAPAPSGPITVEGHTATVAGAVLQIPIPSPLPPGVASSQAFADSLAGKDITDTTGVIGAVPAATPAASLPAQDFFGVRSLHLQFSMSEDAVTRRQASFLPGQKGFGLGAQFRLDQTLLSVDYGMNWSQLDRFPPLPFQQHNIDITLDTETPMFNLLGEVDLVRRAGLSLMISTPGEVDNADHLTNPPDGGVHVGAVADMIFRHRPHERVGIYFGARQRASFNAPELSLGDWNLSLEFGVEVFLEPVARATSLLDDLRGDLADNREAYAVVLMRVDQAGAAALPADIAERDRLRTEINRLERMIPALEQATHDGRLWATVTRALVHGGIGFVLTNKVGQEIFNIDGLSDLGPVVQLGLNGLLNDAGQAQAWREVYELATPTEQLILSIASTIGGAVLTGVGYNSNGQWGLWGCGSF
jgi:hypothetical protein